MELDELVAARGQALLRFAYLLCGDSHRGGPRADGAGAGVREAAVAAADRLEPYVKRMIVNEHLSWRRRRASGEVVSAAPGDAPRPDASQSVVDRDEVWRLLATLPPRQRAVLVRRYYEDLPDAAIAEALGCAESAVRAYASRALAALRLDEEARRAWSCCGRRSRSTRCARPRLMGCGPASRRGGPDGVPGAAG